jgi:hypothetical protein
MHHNKFFYDALSAEKTNVNLSYISIDKKE